MIRIIVFFIILNFSLSSLASCPGRDSLKGIVKHFIEESNNGEITLISTPVPKTLSKVLVEICTIEFGEKIFKSASQLNEQFTFIQVTKETDPDYAVAFRVGFDDQGPNAIHYSLEVDLWKRSVLESKPEKLGEEISNSTLGSLISHEFGHTKIGLHSIDREYVDISTKEEVLDSERIAVKFFENRYRSHKNMPLRKTYFKEGDLLSFLKSIFL